MRLLQDQLSANCNLLVMQKIEEFMQNQEFNHMQGRMKVQLLEDRAEIWIQIIPHLDCNRAGEFKPSPPKGVFSGGFDRGCPSAF